MLPQPDCTSCGPTGLHALYDYWDDPISLDQVVKSVVQFERGGGTLGVILGKHALDRGYQVKIYTYNLHIFDPSWFSLSSHDLIEKLRLRIKNKQLSEKETIAHNAYIEYLRLGGVLAFEDLSPALLTRYLDQGIPLLAGLSSTWLYGAKRENSALNVDDDVAGDPAGHFVVLYGHDLNTGLVNVADPYLPNPIRDGHYYQISLDRIISSILLGVMTFDGNILVIKRKNE